MTPTRNNVEPTTSATDELRRLLDERGVEYKDRDMFGKHVFHWGEPLHGAMFTDSGEWTELVVENATPEQAIAATLGHAYEPPVAAHWDGDVLTLTIPRDPSYIRVRRSAEQPCKVYANESKAIAATLGPGTCHDVAETPRYTDKTRFECSECGYEYSAVGGFGCDYGDEPDFRFCPNCGRKVVGE